MIKPTAIDHIVLRTDRYREMIDFYCDIIGCTLERETSPEFGLTQLCAGNALIDIVDVNGELGKKGGVAPGSTGKNLDHFCLQIEPFDETELITWLQSRGVDCDEFQDRYGAKGMGRSLYISDIAGNTVELRATSG
jgi:glyoxylase I family protein